MWCQLELSFTMWFVGRKADLWEMYACFEVGERLITLWGTVGMGKIWLVVEYGIRYCYVGGIVVICDLSEVYLVDDLLIEVAECFGVLLDMIEFEEVIV